MKQTIFTPSASLSTESAVLNAVSESAREAAKTLLNHAAERETAVSVKAAAEYSAFSRSILSAFTPKGKTTKPLITCGAVYTIGTLNGFLKVTGKRLNRKAFRQTAEITPNGVIFHVDIHYTASECRRIRTTAAVIAAHTEKKTVKSENLTRKEALGW